MARINAANKNVPVTFKKSNSTLQYRVERARDIEAKDNETQINVFVNLAYLFLIEMTLFVSIMRQGGNKVLSYLFHKFHNRF